jgi:hypothetical protein
VRVRIAVVGRPALQGVGDEHIAPLHADLPEQLLQQLPCLSYERQALKVLVGSRCLADEHQLCVGVPGAEDDVRARLMQLAGDAAPSLCVDGLQKLSTLGSAAHRR